MSDSALRRAVDRRFQKSSLTLLTVLERVLGQRDPVVAERRGMRLGALWFRLDAKRRERTMANLRLALPDLSEEQRRELAQKVFYHFGIVAADFLRTPHRTDAELLASVSLPDETNYLLAREPGKGIIAVPPHLGNWERFGHWLQASGRTITVVARDADRSGAKVTERINEIRRMNGMGVVSRGDSAREILRLLRKDQLVGLLPDQNSEEAFIPYFGYPAGTVLGPAVLSIRTGAPILPCSCLRVGPARYEVVLEPPLFAREGETPEELTARMNLSIEKLVRRAPEQYLWIHDRWKSARRKGLLPPEAT